VIVAGILRQTVQAIRGAMAQTQLVDGALRVIENEVSEQSGSAPVPSSGNLSATPVQWTSGRPRWSRSSSTRTAITPCDRASRSASWSDASRRPAATVYAAA